jgi:hypothetical protein
VHSFHALDHYIKPAVGQTRKVWSTRRAFNLTRVPLQEHLIQLEYVWVGGLSALDMRCKTRTWTKKEAPK